MKRLALLAAVVLLGVGGVALYILTRNDEKQTIAQQHAEDAGGTNVLPEPMRAPIQEPAPRLSPDDADAAIAPPPDALPPAEPSASFEATYPGFNQQFRKAVDDNAALRRAQRQCIGRLTDASGTTTFSATLSFSRSADGAAALTDVSVAADDQQLADCIKTAYVKLRPSFSLPEQELPESFRVRADGRWSIDPKLTLEGVDQRIASLTEQMGSMSQDDPQRELLEDQMKLFNCYKTRGLDHRRECFAAD